MNPRLAALAAAAAFAAASLADSPPKAAAAKPAAPIGFVDRPMEMAFVGPRIEMGGWAHVGGGVRAVEVRWEGGKRAAQIGIPRPDVVKARPDAVDATGWHFSHDFSSEPAPPGWDRRPLKIVAIGADGREGVIATRDLVEPGAFTRWRGEARGGQPFYILPATSGVSLGGAVELDSDYRAFISDTAKVGVRVPVLYMRTTRGKAGDYAFDPDWDIERRCGERRIADDSLNGVLKHSAAKKLPVLVTLNGGLWADSPCDVPEWDLNDRLESDPANCQWNNSNEVRRDDALRNLPGSTASPELGRSLTYNIYAAEVRRMKKRNLQQAARLVAEFDRRNPGLLVGVNLDPDVYMNPFYAQREWYDFNPGTVRQFRHWLAASGPYAGRPEPGAPDLRRYARADPLTLAQASRVAGREFRTWDEVDPPRVFPRGGPRPYWKDPWVYEWEVFRRHLVKLHHDELSEWMAEAGLDPDRIWTAQGFTPHYEDSMPLATRIRSSVRNYDTAGVSVEGSRPSKGHLGAIIYGPSAANEVILEEGTSLFAAFAHYDRGGWGSVEFNTTALRTPHKIPPAERGYRALRELWNYGARFVSPMAWNGSHGHYQHHPAYVPFTSWRGTPAEEAAKDFMLARAGLPRGALLWTFGTPWLADRDDWTTALGSTTPQRGSLRVEAGAGQRAVIDSPRELGLLDESRLVVLGTAPLAMEVWARGPADPPSAWKLVASGDAATGIRLERVAGGIDQLRLAISLPQGPATLTRVAVLPVKK